MKEIQPVSIWYNGNIVEATQFWLNSVSDNLSTTAIFEFWLTDIIGITYTSGKLTMEGQDYITYSTSNDSNSYAFNWGATKLNLTII